mgnify:CR=1 FL=1
MRRRQQPGRGAEVARGGRTVAERARVLIDPSDAAGVRAARIVRVMAKDAKLVAIIAIQAIIGPEPHESLAVLVDGEDRTLRKPLFDGQMVEARCRADTVW